MYPNDGWFALRACAERNEGGDEVMSAMLD